MASDGAAWSPGETERRRQKTGRQKGNGTKERDAAIPETRSSSIYNEISSNIFIAVTPASTVMLGTKLMFHQL